MRLSIGWFVEKECKVARKKCRSLYRAAVSDIPTGLTMLTSE